MKNDIKILYWSGLYNVKFVHNYSGSMLVEMNDYELSRSDKYVNFWAAVNSNAQRTENAQSSYRRYKQLFSCLD